MNRTDKIARLAEIEGRTFARWSDIQPVIIDWHRSQSHEDIKIMLDYWEHTGTSVFATARDSVRRKWCQLGKQAWIDAAIKELEDAKAWAATCGLASCDTEQPQ